MVVISLEFHLLNIMLCTMAAQGTQADKSLGELDSEREKNTLKMSQALFLKTYQRFWAKHLRIALCFDLMEALPNI